MRRRITWNLGDSKPEWSNLSLNVSGTGTFQIETGFPVSSAMVALARTYMDRILDAYGNEIDVFVNVESVNDTGFVIYYKNVPENLPLEVNYFAM